MIERITYKEDEFALILRSNYKKDGVSFVTPDHYSQQLAYMKHPKGKGIMAHVHNSVLREVEYTSEVLFIKKGKLRVDFFNNSQEYIESRVLMEGDVILLLKGGHGFEVIEDLEMIEVKQGPYVGEKDKTKFKKEIKELNYGRCKNE
jgi:hypothetical protein